MSLPGVTTTVSLVDEISALLETLTNTGRRLEELTSGQVDTAGDYDGRVLLLRGTREQLKSGELARQAAVLDALPANIALLDVEGVIVSVNASWAEFGDVRAVWGGPGQRVGVNHLHTCEAASEAGCHDAGVISAGIRGVLAGKTKTFTSDYECGASADSRWFRVTVTPVADDRLQGVILMYVNVSAAKEDEAKLQLQAERLTLATAVAKVGVWEWNLVTDQLTWDATMFAIYGLPPAPTVPYETWKSAVFIEDLPAAEAVLSDVIRRNIEAASEFRVRGQGGAVRYISSVQRVVLDRAGSPCRVIGVNVDVTQRREAESALRESQALMTHLAEHDFLTNLPNQMVLRDRIEQAIKLAARNGKKVALLFLDLDRFKQINDSLGHPVGDKLLKSVASRLLTCVRNSDTVSRLGGDEFIVLLPEVEHPAGTALTAKRILQAVGQVHSIDLDDLQIGGSLGISVYPDDGLDADTLIKNADAAMYHAKRQGSSTFCFFHAELNVRANERRFIEQNLRHALERNELSLHYQPKIAIGSGNVVGVEALMRWTHPDRGPIPPAEFIPVAEDCGLILPIGLWALREACTQACAWRLHGLPPISVAVNVSGRQFQGDTFEENLCAILAETGMNPEDLELEVTESLLMTNPALTSSILQNLRAAGVRVAIDDFGTGYSSLSYLQKFPIDTLKIDQSFVSQMTTSPDGISIVTAIITMGKSLGMNIVAEGVETEMDLDILRSLDCAEAQGYYFSRPLPPDAVADFLRRSIELVEPPDTLQGQAPMGSGGSSSAAAPLF